MKTKSRDLYSLSKTLSEVETRYTRLEQAAQVLWVAAKKLRPYFQMHPNIHKPDLSGRMAWWAVELSEFCIQYKPRLAMKG